MAKEKRINYQDSKSSNVFTDETKNALLGILIFLVALIGLVEVGGPLGKLIRYVFVYLLGIYSTFVLLFLVYLGIYVFIKRKWLKLRVNIIVLAVMLIFVFALIYSSKNNWELNNVMNNYSLIFNTISSEGYIGILSSEVAGGFVGYFLYSLLAKFLGTIGIQIVCIISMIAGLSILLRPLVYIIGDKLMKASMKVQNEAQKKEKDREVRPLIFASDDLELVETKKSKGYKFAQETFIDENLKEDAKEVKVSKKTKTNKAFDIFNSDYNFGVNESKKKITNKKFDIFNDELFFDNQTFKEEVNEDIFNVNNVYKEDNMLAIHDDDIPNYSEVESIYEDNNYEEDKMINNEEDNKVSNFNIFENLNNENSYKKVEPTIINLKEEVSVKKEKAPLVDPFKNYVIPPLSLLDDVEPSIGEHQNRQSAEEKAKLLNRKLESLGIKARVVNYRIAASFTRFEIALDENSKVTAFNNIAQDLQLALAVSKISVLVPIPGSRYIGVDIPNVERTKVRLKEVMANDFSYSMKPLLAYVGKDAVGNIMSFDLAKTPHLLVAGSTGSGKSVCMNVLILSLLLHNSPKDLKLILIDPKRVEFTPYAGIPHLACPVITNVSNAGVCLSRLVDFMNDRYKILENIGAKNIEVYNKMMERNGKPKMEYYVCIVDELADLLMNCKSAENSIKEITQLSRAVGIHMIIATQRPSVDVITGTIKNNIPSRIAFTVTTGADSRTILDAVGAENLIGYGDMLVNIVGKYSLTRGQCCLLEDEEIMRVCDNMKRQAEPVYNPRFMDLEPPKPSIFEGDDSGDGDSLVNEIINYMSMGNHVSTTKIQTKFNIGYPRAARIIDKLQDSGIIVKDPQTKQWVLNENRLDTEDEGSDY